MKKYLMTGMAALAFCAAITSCSKGEDLYDENSIIENGVEKIKADYAAAFIATFGQPASNQFLLFSGVKFRLFKLLSSLLYKILF